MSSFTNALIVQKENKQLWKVVEDFAYEVGSLGSGEKITVPKNFETDLASIPRVLWSIFPTDSDYTQAAVLHDWLCYNRGFVEKYYTYKDASWIFSEAMAVLKVKKFTNNLMYRGVLWFGPRF